MDRNTKNAIIVCIVIAIIIVLVTFSGTLFDLVDYVRTEFGPAFQSTSIP